MFICLRIDLDYVPWDSPDAADFGHAEPAVFLRLMDLARYRGDKYQFFASTRTLRAFPASAEAILSEGHALDWLCKHPQEPGARFAEAQELFGLHGHQPLGMAVAGAYPANVPEFAGLNSLRFLSANLGPRPDNLILFPVETKPMREGIRTGQSVRTWLDSTKSAVRDLASRNRSVTVTVRPQVLGKVDPHLVVLREVLDLAAVADLRMQTLREALKT
jgi:hypothetical protein